MPEAAPEDSTKDSEFFTARTVPRVSQTRTRLSSRHHCARPPPDLSGVCGSGWWIQRGSWISDQTWAPGLFSSLEFSSLEWRVETKYATSSPGSHRIWLYGISSV